MAGRGSGDKEKDKTNYKNRKTANICERCGEGKGGGVVLPFDETVAASSFVTLAK